MNDAALTAVVHDGEKASFGLSGVGPMSRKGNASIRRFLRPQVHLINHGLVEDPWWFSDNRSSCSGLEAYKRGKNKEWQNEN